MLDVAKAGARQCVSAFCRHIVRDSLQFWLGKKPLREAGKVRASLKTARVSRTCGFHPYLIRDARVSAKEQRELAICWCWDRVSKTCGAAIVDARTKGSKGLGHSSFVVHCIRTLVVTVVSILV